MTETMTCGTGRAVPLDPVTVSNLLDQMTDFVRHTGKPLNHIELTQKQIAQLRDDPEILRYTAQPGLSNMFAGVRISIKEE